MSLFNEKQSIHEAEVLPVLNNNGDDDKNFWNSLRRKINHVNLISFEHRQHSLKFLMKPCKSF